MAPSNLPNVKLKQKLLHAADAQPQSLSAQGQRFLEADWLNDAIDFFERAGDAEGLTGIRRRAVEEGDVFLLRRCLAALDTKAEPDEWRSLAERAFELGKLQFAREGYRLAGDRKGMDRVEELIRPAEPEPPDPAAPGPDGEADG